MSVSGRIPREFINELLVRVDIVDLIDSHLPLKKTGANYVARCPFHTEKSPSFSVSRNKQMFHCFGCGASGNAISFLMDFNHSDFIEAVEDLAAFVGIDVPRETASASYQAEPKKQDLSQLYSIMEQVTALYVQQLRTSTEGKKAADYLKARSISGDCANDFMLGYAPVQWKELLTRFDQQVLMDCGLLGRSENGEVYGRFRGRLMFPIRDRRGRIVGFGGRVLDDSLPKYLNSPETSLFSKGKEVYGLHELLAKNSKPQRILIVEGYMDVIALAQFGIHHTVAVLGTAASRTHLELLFRFTSELVFCFDGDNAGQTAAWRLMESAFASLKDGKSCRIMTLPAQHDPDSLVREQGVEAFSEQVQTAIPLSDYFFGHFENTLNLSETEGRAQLVSQAKPYLEKLPESIFKEMMLERLKNLSGFTKLDVLENTATLSQKPNQQQRPEQGGRQPLPRLALALLVQNPELIEIIERREIDWACLKFEGVEKFTSILQTILHEKPANTGALLEYYRGHSDEPIIKKLADLPLEIPTSNEAAEFSGAIDKLLAQSIDDHRRWLLKKLETTGLTPQEKEQLQKLFNTK
ncbi:MAG: DNA primase [Methylococcales bacterium]|nr:DNA primase [Methylococcales bacterium]